MDPNDGSNTDHIVKKRGTPPCMDEANGTSKRLKMNPPNPHHTRSQGQLPPEFIVQDSERHKFGRAGRLAPKWLEDLLTGALNDGPNPEVNVGCAGTKRHELMIIGLQSVAATSEVFESNGRRQIYSCICANCRYHFLMRVNSPEDAACGLTNHSHERPFHHLVWSGPYTPDESHPKYYPVIEANGYQCSATKCGFWVGVEASTPRLKENFLAFLLDEQRFFAQREAGVKSDPERFDNARVRDMQPNAPVTLWRYLKDIVEGTTETAEDGSVQTRKIDQRNRTFFLQFGTGPESAELFGYLEFEEFKVGNSEMWRVPYTGVSGPTPIASRLAFFQDMKSEVETIITQSKTPKEAKPCAALDFLKSALHLEGHYARTAVHGGSYASEDYDMLGMTSDLHESVFWYAFSCQRQTLPAREDDFFQALRRLAQGRHQEDLEVKIMEYESMKSFREAEEAAVVPMETENEQMRQAVENSLRESRGDGGLPAAYRHFGFEEAPETHDVLIGKYRAMCESSPAQKSQHLEMLAVICWATRNNQLLKESMDLEAALDYLTVERDTPPDSIIAVADWLAGDGGKDYRLVATALEVISKARDNCPTLLNAGSMIKAKSAQSYDTSPAFLMAGDEAGPQEPVNMKLPVGLENIHNTCYLNSILQYLFTVKPVRELVLDFDRYRLDATEENLRARYIDPGSTHLERGEAFAGQQFALELQALFSQLQHVATKSVRPKQKLALAALKNPSRLVEDGAKILAKSSGPPPVPPRRSTPPPVPPRNAEAPKVTVNPVSDIDNTETSSTVSSQTLVNQVDDGSDHGYVSVVAPGSGRSGGAPEAPFEMDEEGSKDVDMDDLADILDVEPRKKDESGDVIMAGSPAEPAAAPEEKITAALDDTSVMGTGQEDVEEVMGTIIGHLRAAITPTGEDDAETGVQKDSVLDTFFWTSVTYTKRESDATYNQTKAINRWVTAYPGGKDETISLLQALEHSFQRELLDAEDAKDAKPTKGRLERFAAIVKLPPILHIHIQRAMDQGAKNDAPITIPDALYLDRFMDCPTDSELFQKRKRSWILHDRLLSLKGPDGKAEEADPDGVDPGTLERYREEVRESFLKDADGPHGFEIIDDDIRNICSDFGLDLPASLQPRKNALTADAAAKLAPSLAKELLKTVEGAHGLASADQPAAELAKLLRESPGPELGEKLDEELVLLIKARQNPELARKVIERLDRTLPEQEEQCREELKRLFADDMGEQEYRLHAVVCHAGSKSAAGHYWVWIYDFDEKVWRKYNDSTVSEEHDTNKVLTDLSTRGEPYYLAYVRAKDIERMVNVPGRTTVEDAPDS